MTTTMKKILLVALVVGYVLSPADAMAGPIDDIIVMLLGWMANGRLNKRR